LYERARHVVYGTAANYCERDHDGLAVRGSAGGLADRLAAVGTARCGPERTGESLELFGQADQQPNAGGWSLVHRSP
jgi:hypothetical protein